MGYYNLIEADIALIKTSSEWNCYYGGLSLSPRNLPRQRPEGRAAQEADADYLQYDLVGRYEQRAKIGNP